VVRLILEVQAAVVVVQAIPVLQEAPLHSPVRVKQWEPLAPTLIMAVSGGWALLVVPRVVVEVELPERAATAQVLPQVVAEVQD
jgi:hypothetical protein